MKVSEIVTAWNNAFLAGDQAAFRAYMTDDFVFTGPVPQPLGPDAYAGLMHTLQAAMPDMDNHLQISSESGDTAHGSVQIEGTHTGDFDLSAMNMSVIPPTNKPVKLPEETFVIKVKEGKISEFAVSVPADGGLKGILTQIGMSS